ncbi:hypothetical protein [Brevibacterium sp.]|uniref:hypothetical protein n=1 Tax=Brevibacterium sp. TaxID=1701 RepID=UPI0028114DA3|nr:hypothetical protein [Brevibacterium sp.]
MTTQSPQEGLPDSVGGAELDPDQQPRKGKRRLLIGAGSLLGIGALVTAAAFTDYALLDFGAKGFGGDQNAYNIQVSTGQEATVASVKQWVEANPNAEPLEIAGADALSPGGEALQVNIPVLNASERLDSTLSLTLENTTANPSKADSAYANLLRFEYAAVPDASSAPGHWKQIPTGSFSSAGSTSTVDLGDLKPKSGEVVVLRISLADGADQAATNAANGGGAAVQARIDGSSK